MTIDQVLELHGRLMRAIHFDRARRNGPWADLPVTLSQLRALGLMACRSEGVSGRELASALDVSPSAITPLVDRLVEHGLARREEDHVDRRITRLHPTPEGMLLLERTVAGQREHMSEVLSRLSQTDLEVVAKAFSLLHAAINRGGECGTASNSDEASVLP